MTLKETLVDCLRDSGYDFMEACKLAQDKLDEVKEYTPGEYVIYAGKYTVTIKKER